jgi:hypothetical protein
MTKHYTISIVVSGEQGEVMRSDSKMPLAMIDVLKDALDLAKHYQTVADALAVGPITIPDVCSATGVTQNQAMKLLKASGAKVVCLNFDTKIAHWGLVKMV